MSNSSGNGPLYTQKNISLVSRAIQEFNKVNHKQTDESSIKPLNEQNIGNSKDAASSATNSATSSATKGANLPKRRSVLGRGLSALMSPTTVPIDLALSDQAASSVPAIEISNTENRIENIPASKVNEVPQLTKTELDRVSEVKKSSNDANATEPGLMFIGIDKLTPNPNQPRKSFSQAEIRELASSIRRSGLLQPILVRQPSNPNSRLAPYEIIAGERRWRAAKEAGLISIPAILKSLSDREALEIGIIENVQRLDLNPIEEAEAYHSLVNDFGCSHEELSKIVSKDRSSITNSLRLLSLPASIRALLADRKLSAGHARAILSIKSEEEQLSLANDLINLKLSVRAAEAKVKSSKSKSSQANQKQDLSTSDERNAALEERIRRALGTKVKVNLSASGKGEVKISFFSRPEFEAFLEKVEA